MESWGAFYVIIKETFTSTLNCLVGCDANPGIETPEIKTPDHMGSIAVIGGKRPGDSQEDTPDKVVILTNGKEYEYDKSPPASEVFKQPDTTTGFTLPTVEVHLMTSMTMADVDGDTDLDAIATFKGDPNGEPGTTKVYLNPGSNDFTDVTPIVIKAPEYPGSTTPFTTDVVVADVNNDGTPDIVTVSDGGENVLYLGPLTFDPNTKEATNPGTILGKDPATKYDPVTKKYDPPTTAHDTTPRNRWKWPTSTMTATSTSSWSTSGPRTWSTSKRARATSPRQPRLATPPLMPLADDKDRRGRPGQ